MSAERGKGRLRRLLALLLALLIPLCLPACGSPDPICGSYRCVGAEALGLPVKGELLGDGAVLTLSADGRGTLERAGVAGELRWTRSGESLSIDVGGTLYDAALQDGQILLALEPGLSLRFAPAEEDEPIVPEETGAWYGWWSVENAAGAMPDSWRDCCACLETGGYGPVLRFWDEDSSYEEPLALLRLRREGTELVSESGWFLLTEVRDGDWRFDPAQESLEFIGSYRHGEEAFDYQIHLRSWGTLWEEETLRRPFRYVDWYLPLVEAKAAMPHRIG